MNPAINIRSLIFVGLYLWAGLQWSDASPGDVDSSFNPGSGPDDRVAAVAVQSDGKIIVAGAFFAFDGVPQNLVARLNADGSLDTTFPSPFTANGEVYSIAVQPDGKILFAGITAKSIIRLNADGTIDATFKADVNFLSYAEAVAVQPDGKILIGGSFNAVNGFPAHNVARLNPDGSLDPTFNAGTGASGATIFPIYTINPEPGGRLLVGGSFSSFNGFQSAGFIRLNSDGSVDPSLGSSTATINGMNAEVRAFLVKPDGGFYLHKFDSEFEKDLLSGAEDTTFQKTKLSGTVTAISLDIDSKVYVAGSFFPLGSDLTRNFARFNADGAFDPTFNVGSGANAVVNAVTVQGDGKILVGGTFTTFNGSTQRYLVRLLGGNVPVIFSDNAGAGRVGTPFGFQVLTDSTGVATYAATGLPAGVVIDAVTGIISGTPTAAGKFAVALSVTDAVGTGTETLTLTIRPPSIVTMQVKGSALASEAGGKGKILVARDGSDIAGDLTVFYKVKGSARNGVDYQKITSSILIPAGSTNVKLKIRPINNSAKDGTRTVNLKLTDTPTGNYTVGSPKKATILILDND